MGHFSIDAAPYIAIGWHVFPVRRGTKQGFFAKELMPDLPQGGFYWGTTDPQRILRYERELPGGPVHNIALRTGAESGVVVIDLDYGKGPEAHLALEDLAQQGKTFPPTPGIVDTPSGGEHWYYRYRGPLTSSTGRVGKHIDIRADSGLVLLPPSVRDDRGGSAYTWRGKPFGHLLPLVPRWLQEQFQPPPVERTYRHHTIPSAASIDKVAWRLEALARTPKGQRNDALFRLYVQALDWGHPPAEIGPLFSRAALDAGLEPKEIIKTMRSAEHREREDPRLRPRRRT